MAPKPHHHTFPTDTVLHLPQILLLPCKSHPRRSGNQLLKSRWKEEGSWAVLPQPSNPHRLTLAQAFTLCVPCLGPAAHTSAHPLLAPSSSFSHPSAKAAAPAP